MRDGFYKSLILTLAIGLSSCGIIRTAEDTLDQVKQTNEKIEDTNNKMDITNAAIHNQTLAVALNSLLAAENTEVLTPPTDLIPFAEKFTEEATSEELIETFHLLYTSVIKGFESEPSGDKKLKRRQVRLTAASALAALAPAEKVNEIFQAQINEEGEYLDSTFVFALCRYNFTRDFLLKPLLDKGRTPTLKLLKLAHEHFLTVKGIAGASYVDYLKVTIPEFVVTNQENGRMEALEDAVNPTEHRSLGRVAVRKFDDKNNPKFQTAEAQALINGFR